MIIRRDIEQGSDEWHQIRYGKISGTASKGLFKDTDTLLNDLIACRLEQWQPEPKGYQNDAMIRGNELEPFAIMELSRKIKVEFESVGWIQSDIDLLGISPDRISKCEKKAVEAKCPGRSVHIATILENDIPLNNIHQCLHYFTVMPELKELHFISFRPECKIRLFHKVLTPESIINLGTNAKPVMKSVFEASELARKTAKELQSKIDSALQTLLKTNLN